MRRQNGNERMKRSRHGNRIQTNTSAVGEVVVGRPPASRNPLPPVSELSMNDCDEDILFLGSYSNGSSRKRRLTGRHHTGRTSTPTPSNEQDFKNEATNNARQLSMNFANGISEGSSSSDCSRKRRNVVPLSRSTKTAKLNDDAEDRLLDETDALSVTDKDEWKSMVAPTGTPCLVRFRFPCDNGSHTETIEVTLSTKLSALFCFIHGLGYAQSEHKIVLSFPRREYSLVHGNMTLEELGFTKSEVVDTVSYDDEEKTKPSCGPFSH